jgi:hypothetical protein
MRYQNANIARAQRSVYRGEGDAYASRGTAHTRPRLSALSLVTVDFARKSDLQ